MKRTGTTYVCNMYKNTRTCTRMSIERTGVHEHVTSTVILPVSYIYMYMYAIWMHGILKRDELLRLTSMLFASKRKRIRSEDDKKRNYPTAKHLPPFNLSNCVERSDVTRSTQDARFLRLRVAVDDAAATDPVLSQHCAIANQSINCLN